MNRFLRVLLLSLLFSGNQLFPVTVRQLIAALPDISRQFILATRGAILQGEFISPSEVAWRSWENMDRTLENELDFVTNSRSPEGAMFVANKDQINGFIYSQPDCSFLRFLLSFLIVQDVIGVITMDENPSSAP